MEKDLAIGKDKGGIREIRLPDRKIEIVKTARPPAIEKKS